MTDDTEQCDLGGEAPCFADLLEDGTACVPDADLVQLAHRMADALVIADADGTITFWNESAEALFGWTPAEAVGRNLDLIIPERLRRRHHDGYERVMATGKTSYGDRLLEVPALHRDGRTMSIAFTVTLLTHLGEDAPHAIAAVIRDDTERFQERRQLKAQVAALTAQDAPPAT
jgi:PAS domain S-box-containing protein